MKKLHKALEKAAVRVTTDFRLKATLYIVGFIVMAALMGLIF